MCPTQLAESSLITALRSAKPLIYFSILSDSCQIFVQFHATSERKAIPNFARCPCYHAPMKLFLYGHTAFEYWLHARSRDVAAYGTDRRVFYNCAPSAHTAAHLEELMPYLSKPYHCLVPSRSDERRIANVVAHVSQYQYPQDSFSQIACGVYASSPELCFAQLARSDNNQRLIFEGYLLCSKFAFSCEGDPTQVKLPKREPVTSVKSINRYLVANSKLAGSAPARKALAHVIGNAASPAETQVTMKLTLPCRLGGYGLPKPILNHRIDLSSRARKLATRSYHEADLCWPDAKLILEYDSDSEHLNPTTHAEDAIKRGVLEEMGYQVITITNHQLRSTEEMANIAQRAAYRLGVRLRPRAKGFEDAQRELFTLR